MSETVLNKSAPGPSLFLEPFQVAFIYGDKYRRAGRGIPKKEREKKNKKKTQGRAEGDR